MSLNAETLKINITTVAAIVMASFSLYFFIGGLIETGIREAKVYAITLDIERDEDVIEMYRFQIENNIGTPQAPSRMAALQAKVSRRVQERLLLESR